MLSHFQQALDKRKEEGILRILKPPKKGVDFYSNDYLGFARNRELQDLLLMKIIENPEILSGSTGSRLISGNSMIVTEIEAFIAKEHQYESALLFPSGYNANLALFSTLPSRHDTIIVDEFIHRSVHDACAMSHAKKIKFRHNDPESLENVLKRQKRNCYIAVESLYSMDGDGAPLDEICELAEKYSAYLIVDEAHAFGVFGKGLVNQNQLQNRVFATVITYGKALGMHGAAILSSELIKSYLINFASPFIYTTSSPDFHGISIKTGYDFLALNQKISMHLQNNIKIFRNQNLMSLSSGNSPVQAVLMPDNERLRKIQQTLFENGLISYAVYSPTVKKGTERLRICLHSFNTEEEITKLTDTIKEFI
ncbi:pyridoxal phosphate-dependent aminotransferase family protein [Chryseobacterium sp. JUb7]|uniref:aminotransferase class I/II-fold pyridoxal phosphate-dependent enzyme n=1 Tax=Chryseobacterium sp. JUb7 TaxID=2940599 RepID=UPI0021691D95|nr:pyridoxal phosphate-dependent aminotransferase family protein [Chryseobacterium sp. JUb7]MCS3528997.1 8-amino-7-oxononanoate synthase [Chryseobacterium sp. JUb7]